MASLGDRLARIRGFRRMSQQELAERTGLKVQNISRIETDQREHVRSDTLRRLAEALDCSTDYLVGLTDDPQPAKRRRRKVEDAGDLFPTMPGMALETVWHSGVRTPTAYAPGEVWHQSQT